MDENHPPAYLPPPAPGPSLGCFAKGCLTVVVVGFILGIMIGGLVWYGIRDLRPYLSRQPAEIRVYPATEAQYQTLEAKIRDFVQTVNDGRQATLTLTADELNTLVARDPQYSSLRGKDFFAIAKDQISAETNTLLNDNAPESQRLYFHGRVVFDASFVSGDFTVVLRRIEPLNGGPTPAIVAWALGQPNFSDNFSRVSTKASTTTSKATPARPPFSTGCVRLS